MAATYRLKVVVVIVRPFVAMRGSGLSIERFIKGKAQRSKSDAKSKKKIIVHKAQRRRQYAKVKKQERSASTGVVDADSAAGLSFYDRFFSKLTSSSSSSNDNNDVKEVCAVLPLVYEG